MPSNLPTRPLSLSLPVGKLPAPSHLSTRIATSTLFCCWCWLLSRLVHCRRRSSSSHLFNLAVYFSATRSHIWPISSGTSSTELVNASRVNLSSDDDIVLTRLTFDPGQDTPAITIHKLLHSLKLLPTAAADGDSSGRPRVTLKGVGIATPTMRKCAPIARWHQNY